MKYFLVFYADCFGDKEECNVYYSWLVKAETEEEAMDKVRFNIGNLEGKLDAEPMNLIE